MNKRFETIILKCQELRKKHGFDYEEKCKAKIEKFSREIIEKNLIAKCFDETFAKQLCIMNCLEYKNKNKSKH